MKEIIKDWILILIGGALEERFPVLKKIGCICYCIFLGFFVSLFMHDDPGRNR